MTRLDRLILSEVVAPFIGSALLFTGLFFAAGELVRYAEYLQKGESWVVVAQLMALTLPGVIALTFPMAILLATLLGFGRLSGDSEIIALFAAGISFERIMIPVAVFGLFISFIGLWFNNQIVPAASRGRNVIIDRVKNQGGGNVLSTTRLTADLRDKATGELLYLVHIEGAANLASGKLERVGIQTWDNGRMTGALYAPEATWVIGTKKWILKDAVAVGLNPDGSAAVMGFGGVRTQEKELETPDDLAAFAGRPEDIDTSQLRARAALLRKGGYTDRAREFEVEVAKRNAMPFSSFAFALVGAPLGVRPSRQGKGLGFGLSVIVTFFYWIGLQVCSVIGRGGGLPADIALMLPNVVCIGVGIFLVRRVLRS
jgi:lipopolysaccharide export system permease protein